ncbi:uncharacterized protein LOC114277883 [Camellia sinensis]|uniref:uncharacterized protein LOC114277883 n=1 Tax=Camellia sinensis TaxID=4442 RepID=UPI001035FE13|nr:uncharacterized protein LOC114277883 [Camellia sinensis]
MAMGGSSNDIPDDDFDENKPLWKYITKLAKPREGRGNCQLQCNFCNNTFKGSYTRVSAHLLKLPRKGIGACKKVTSQKLSQLQNENDAAKLRIKNTHPKNVPLPSSSVSVGSSNAYESKKRRTCGSGSVIEKDVLRRGEGVPFNLVRNPYYVSSYTFAANHNIPGYLPPDYNLLRTKLLQKERANIDRLLQPIRGTWKEKKVSIVSDSWSDSQRRPLINFMAVSKNGPMFIKAVDCSGETKDKYFTANLMKEVINEVGASNVVQVITDNAPNSLKNIYTAKNVERNEVTYEECSWISDIIEDGSIIKNFISNHSMRLAIYNEFVSLKLLSVAETRFASTIVMLKRLKLIKRGLQAMVISDKWNCYREDDVGKAKFVKEKILDDVWWDYVDYILSFTGPIYDILRACDMDKHCLHFVYDMWDTMIK